jgi:small subunit ribosomal protein S17
MTRHIAVLRGATKRKTMVGRVVSDKMDKTIVVAVERLARHRVYKRVLRLTSKFKAHDEDNTARVGDRVRIEESRPMSREKRWRLVEVVTRAGAPVEMVSEEPETTEALGGPGHPGRSRAEAEQATARAAGETVAGGGAAGVGASDGEVVADSGAMGAAGEAPQAKRAVAPEPADTRAAASGEAPAVETPASGKAARK